VADALDYAAAQGVLHRDVKPANLLLDVWGGVWLTDFGLAKASGTADLTGPGDLLGTLRYMAPERFAGRADARGDVYALGLTLYEALALRPAFTEQGPVPLLQQISAGEAPRLDRLDPRPPRDLVTVVHKAMARDPADRYQTAAALAEDLRRFLDDRPITARRRRLAERGWRWCLRNPAAAGLLAAVLALVTLAVAGGFWWQAQRGEQRERAARAGRDVEAALERVAGLRRDGLWEEAKAVLGQAEGRLDDAPDDDLRGRLGQARADLGLAARLEEIRLKRGTFSDGTFDFQSAAREYADAFGQARLEVAGDGTAVATQIRESAIREELVAALDDWASVTRDARWRARLLRLARLADPDPKWRDRFRDPAVWRDRPALERLAEEASVGELSPQLLTMLGKLLSVQREADAEPFLRMAQHRHPEDFWLNYELANFLLDRRKPGKAVGFYRAALARRPQSAAVYSNLGMALKESGQVEEALAPSRRAVELNPDSPGAHNNLGNALRAAGRGDEAIAAYHRALALDPKLAQAHHNLGIALHEKGRSEEAVKAFGRALELGPRLAAAHNSLGKALLEMGRLEDSITALRCAVDLEPKRAKFHGDLGAALSRKGLLDEAVAAMRRATDLDPGSALDHRNLGVTLLRQGRFAEARVALQRCLDLFPVGDPLRKGAQESLGRCEHLLALEAKLPALLEGKGQPADAAEQRDLALLCQRSKRPYAAARFYAAVFAARPPLAEDLGTQDRYNGACAAALAAAGHGADARKLDDAERARLRRQALDWLTADLAARAKLIKDSPRERARAHQALRHWQTDGDLAGLRDAERLARLPPDEQKACRKLWAEVDALLRRSGPGK
jgi:serine/threonine-protein kinase